MSLVVVLVEVQKLEEVVEVKEVAQIDNDELDDNNGDHGGGFDVDDNNNDDDNDAEEVNCIADELTLTVCNQLPFCGQWEIFLTNAPI